MREKLEQIKKLVEELLSELPETDNNPQEEMSEEFRVLKNLLESEDWPEAVYSAQIADENLEQDKEERAEGISDMILPPLDNKKFLDLGCGEGHISKYNSKFAEISVGFDIRVPEKSPFEWEKEEEKFLLTTDFEKVREKGPYDVILLYFYHAAFYLKGLFAFSCRERNQTFGQGRHNRCVIRKYLKCSQSSRKGSFAYFSLENFFIWRNDF
jgi:hypothetical protein